MTESDLIIQQLRSENAQLRSLLPVKCQFENGIVIRPDGIHELDPCVYQPVEKYRNVTVEVCKCKTCGHIELMWTRQENTEDISEEVNIE